MPAAIPWSWGVLSLSWMHFRSREESIIITQSNYSFDSDQVTIAVLVVGRPIVHFHLFLTVVGAP